MVTRVRHVVTKNGKSAGQRMAMFTLSDAAGNLDGVLFAETFAKHGELLQQDRIVVMVGRVDHARGTPNLVIDRVIPIEDAAQHLATRMEITVEAERAESASLAAALQMASGLLRQSAGSVAALRGRPVDVYVRVLVGGREVQMRSSALRVVPDRQLLSKLAGMLEGVGRVRIEGGYVPQRERPAWQKRAAFRGSRDEAEV
jgi:DNA polymerase-3 subunit alpha